MIGVTGLSWAVFTAVSYIEVRKKIDEAVDAGQDPYELKVEKRPGQPVKTQRKKPTQKGKSKKERKKR